MRQSSGSQIGRARKPRWRRALRWAMAGLAGLGVVYAALPWLIPKRWLADRLADRIAAAIRRRVDVGQLGISWSEGMVMRDLIMRRRPEFGPGRFLHIQRVRCEFTPLRTLWSGRVGELRIEQPECWIVVNEDGELNVSDLDEIQAALPSLQYRIEGAVIQVVSVAGEGPLRLELPTVMCTLDPGTGGATYRALGRLARGRDTLSPSTMPKRANLSLDGELAVPKLKAGIKLAGGGSFAWRRLDLATLPVHLVPTLGVNRLRGVSAGKIQVQAEEDLGVSFRIETHLKDVAVVRHDGRVVNCTRAAAAMSGHWDPAGEILTIQDGFWEIPRVLRVEGDGDEQAPAMVLSRFGAEPVRLRLRGEVLDLAWLAERLTAPQRVREERIRAKGPCSFELSYVQGVHQDELRFEADARDSGLWIKDQLNLPPRAPARVAIWLRRDRQPKRLREPDPPKTKPSGPPPLGAMLPRGDPLGPRAWANGELYVMRLEGRAGTLTLHASAQVPVLTNRPAESVGPALGGLAGARISATLSCEDGQLIRSQFPGLARLLSTGNLKGPARLSWDQAPQGGFANVRCSVDLPGSSALEIGPYFAKPRGVRAWATAGMEIGRGDRGTIRAISAEIRAGEGRLWVDPAQSVARFALRRCPQGPAGRAKQAYQFSGYLSARVHAERVEQLLARSPYLASCLDSHGSDQAKIKGRCDGALTVNVGLSPVNRVLRVVAGIDATNLAIDLGEQLCKPMHQLAQIDVDYSHDACDGQTDWRGRVALQMAGLEGHIERKESSGAQIGSQTDDAGGGSGRLCSTGLAVSVRDIQQALAYTPALAGVMERYGLSGGGEFRVEMRESGEATTYRLCSDLSAMGFRVPGRQPFSKPPAVPFRLEACFEVPQASEQEATTEISIDKLWAQLAGSTIEVTSGRAETGAQEPHRASSDQLASQAQTWLRGSCLRELRLDATAHVVFDSTLRSLSPVIDRTAERYDLIGRTEVQVRLSVSEQGTRVAARVDPTRMHINAAPYFVKPVGVPVIAELDVATGTASDEERSRGIVPLILERWSVGTEACQASGTGRIGLRHPGGRKLQAPDTSPWAAGESVLEQLQRVELTGDCRFPRLEELGKLVPALANMSLGGAASAKLIMTIKDGLWCVGPSSIALEQVSFVIGDAPVQLDGGFEFSTDALFSSGLKVQFPGFDGVVGGHVDGLPDAPKGQLCLAADQLDVDRVGEFSRRVDQEMGGRWLTGDARDRREEWRRLFDLLSRCDLSGYVHVGRLRGSHEAARVLLRLDEVTSHWKVQGGQLDAPVMAAANAGWIEGRFAMAMDRPDPLFDLSYSVHRVEPVDRRSGVDLRPYLRRDFPGLTATGVTTMIDSTRQRLFPEPGTLNYPVGKGELIVEGGTVVGRAAPLWMTRIFPGLNFARFDFSRMHDWFEKRANGRIDHQMIFQGRLYHLYMDGYSTAARRIHYEVGIDLLARLDSKYWADSKQGRIPLFIKEGRVGPDGLLLDETVRYLPVHQVIYKLLYESNPIRTAYYALRKKLGAQQ